MTARDSLFTPQGSLLYSTPVKTRAQESLLAAFRHLPPKGLYSYTLTLEYSRCYRMPEFDF